jgi:hypothetical protein
LPEDLAVFIAANQVRQVVLVAFLDGLQPFGSRCRISLLKVVLRAKYAKILKIRIVYGDKEFLFFLIHINMILTKEKGAEIRAFRISPQNRGISNIRRLSYDTSPSG